MKIGEKIKETLPRKFDGIIVWNEDNTPIFTVENSIRNEDDPDHVNLRKRILKEVKSLYMKRFPVKYFYFYTLIAEFQEKGILIKKYDDLFEICKNSECRINSHEEFDNLLSLFTQTGEIIHYTNDNILREFVIFDPQAVVNILSQLITVPKMCDQHQSLVQDWHLLEKFGICSETLLKRHMSSNSFDEFEKAVYLLERLNLLCKIQTNKPQQKERYYLIPALLPNKLPYPGNFWQDEASDYVFYVQATPALPRTAFLKLIAHCAAYDDNLCLDDTIVLNASQRKALFTYKNKFSYKLETLSSERGIDAQNGNAGPSKWDGFLRIVIRPKMESDNLEMLRFLWETLSRIVSRDFSKCKLKLGVQCPCEPPHQDITAQEGLHLLPLIGDSSRFTDKLSDDFWCCGRVVTIRNGKVPKSGVESKLRASSLLSDLPYGVTRRVCDCLNVPSALGRDWTDLAGRLGKTAREVELLRVRCPGYQCDALLLDWIKTHPESTVQDLVMILQDMQRYDAISELGTGQQD